MTEGVYRTEVRYLDKESDTKPLRPEDTGWWILDMDADGFCYDAVGPYDSEEEALRVVHETRTEEDDNDQTTA